MNNDVIFVSGLDDLKNLKKYQKIKFICTSCGQEVERLYIKSRLPLISRFKCKKCNSEQTCLEKYGYKNGAQVPEIKQKFQQACLEKYGNICSLNGSEQIKKKQETWQKHFGKTNPFQQEAVIQKIKQNNLQKYGQEYAFNTPEALQKSIETKLEKGTLGINKIRYKLDNLTFDSSWEVYFYLWAKDNKIDKIERNSAVFDIIFEGKNHKALVDFKIKEELFEIKNPYLLNDTPYSTFKCQYLKKKGVIFITDPKPYITYVKKKYGNHYIDQFKV